MKNEVIWSAEGIQISSLEAIPQDQQVTVSVKVYDPSKSSFEFPQAYSLSSSVYMITISDAMTDASLICGIQVRLTNYRRGSMQVLQASCTPKYWEANRSAPVFNFSPIEPQRIQSQGGALTLCLDSPRCYLVVAGNTCMYRELTCIRNVKGKPQKLIVLHACMCTNPIPTYLPCSRGLYPPCTDIYMYYYRVYGEYSRLSLIRPSNAAWPE